MTEPPPYPDPNRPPEGQQPQQPWQPPGQYAGPTQPGYPPPPPPPPGHHPYAAVPPTHGKATLALILGILAFVMCGPFTGIPAIFVGRSARNEIDASQGRLGGRNLAVAGYILGIVSAVLTVLAVLALIALFVFGAAVSDSFSDTCSTTNGDNSFTVEC